MSEEKMSQKIQFINLLMNGDVNDFLTSFTYYKDLKNNETLENYIEISSEILKIIELGKQALKNTLSYFKLDFSPDVRYFKSPPEMKDYRQNINHSINQYFCKDKSNKKRLYEYIVGNNSLKSYLKFLEKNPKKEFFLEKFLCYRWRESDKRCRAITDLVSVLKEALENISMLEMEMDKIESESLPCFFSTEKSEKKYANMFSIFQPPNSVSIRLSHTPPKPPVYTVEEENSLEM